MLSAKSSLAAGGRIRASAQPANRWFDPTAKVGWWQHAVVQAWSGGWWVCCRIKPRPSLVSGDEDGGLVGFDGSMLSDHVDLEGVLVIRKDMRVFLGGRVREVKKL